MPLFLRRCLGIAVMTVALSACPLIYEDIPPPISDCPCESSESESDDAGCSVQIPPLDPAEDAGQNLLEDAGSSQIAEGDDGGEEPSPPNDAGESPGWGPICGNGVIEGGEDCDDGLENDDQVSDACRSDCREARCGDGTRDTGEACDDHNPYGGDGCSAVCQYEIGQLEREPNDTWEEAQRINTSQPVYGRLFPEERDCFSFFVTEYAYLDIEVTDGGDGCSGDSFLTLTRKISGGEPVFISEDDNAGIDYCPHLDPYRDRNVRYLDAGDYTICLSGFWGSASPGYALSIYVGPDSCAEGVFIPADWEDQDYDGILEGCDPDDDNDGVLDEDDNCPNMSNGSSPPTYASDHEGFYRRWLLLGPFQDNDWTYCLSPGGDQVTGEGEISIVAGDVHADRSWAVHIDDDAYIDYDAVLGGGRPRQAFALIYLWAEEAREVVLGIGSDDGVRVWLNGEQVWENGACRGANPDQDQVPVVLQPGFNPLMIKVRDLSGGWAMYFRLLDEFGEPILDVPFQLSLATQGDNQADSDNDGIGDVCDETP